MDDNLLSTFTTLTDIDELVPSPGLGDSFATDFDWQRWIAESDASAASYRINNDHACLWAPTTFTYNDQTDASNIDFDPSAPEIEHVIDEASLAGLVSSPPIAIPKSRRAVFDLDGDDDELQDADLDNDGISEFNIAPNIDRNATVTNLAAFNATPRAINHTSSVHLLSTSLPARGVHAPRTKRPRLPDQARTLLDSWFKIHRSEPYLKAEDANALAHLTGITPQQVRTYIANARTRRLNPPPVAGLARTTSVQSVLGLDNDLESPGLHVAASSGLSSPAFDRNESMTSFTSFASSVSAASLAPRKGRRRHRASSTASAGSSISRNKDALRIYQCTFCASDFHRKSDWKRHEQATHFPQEEWVCQLTGTNKDFTMFMINGETPTTATCAFCGDIYSLVDDEHLEQHNVQECAARPESDRAFARKDKLQQHLTQVHQQSQLNDYMATNWKRSIQRNNIILRCGFCTAVFEPSEWAKRIEHVAEHFEAGIDMSHWIGEPGGITNRLASNNTGSGQLFDIAS